MRDPRMDPMPGDVLCGKNGGRMETRTVERVGQAFGPGRALVWARRGKSARNLYYASEWRKWAKDAEVVQIGEGK